MVGKARLIEISLVQLGEAPVGNLNAPVAATSERVAIGEGLEAGSGAGDAAGASDENAALQARLDSLRRD